MFLRLDISTDEFPALLFDRRVVFYKNHDINNSPIRTLRRFDFISSNVLCLVHLIIRNFNKGQDNGDDVKRFETYFFEEQIRKHPGQRMVIMFDMSDTGLRHLVSSIYSFT